MNRNRIVYKSDSTNNYLYQYHGFFTLCSQPDNNGSRSIVRDNFGQVSRKPLKMKKTINERNTRIIPIINNELWRILTKRAKQAFQDWKGRTNQTNNKGSYLLFNGITQTTSRLRLIQAFKKANLPYRSFHCCRHSRGTYLHGKTGDKELTMKWLGHSSEKVHERYIHTYEGLMREIKAKEMDWENEI